MSTSRVAPDESHEALKRKETMREEEVSSGYPIDFDDEGVEFDIECDKEDEINRKGKKRVKLETQPKKTTPRSEWWAYFEKYKDVDGVMKAKCIFCGRSIMADSKQHGVSSLKKHIMICKKAPDEIRKKNTQNQTHLAFQPSRSGDEGSQALGTWIFNQDKVSEALNYMLIVDELPFRIVECLGFKHFVSVACPNFKIPSRRTLTKNIYNVYVRERVRLKSLIKKSQRICITTDTWTSIQRVNYMCLTAHFIDENWKLHKRILNFCPISGHKSEEVGKGVEKCLLDWGIDKVFTITVDNASSNDGAIGYLQKKFDNWGTNILGGKYVHMRCVAHIINLIVQDGLKGKDEHMAIARIRGAVKYIRNSPARYKKFLECVELEKLESGKMLTLDVCTRWNSTYLMLESATRLERAFDAYGDNDLGYRNDLSKRPFDGVPTVDDWERGRILIKFLGHFYKLTLAISGTLYVTSSTVFHEISEVDVLLRKLMESDDYELSEMSRRMKEKFDKYWGPIEKMNLILYFAVILDPRHKLGFIEFSFDELYSDVLKSALMKDQLKQGMFELFNEYKLMYEKTPRNEVSSSSCVSSTCGVDASPSDVEILDLKTQYKKFKRVGRSEHVKSELEKYLSEEPEEEDEVLKFDILNWWKVNSPRFPILSKLARDILASPVSTVASESAFSTGGRVLDPFRSSLSPRIVQALICGQDWLRKDYKPISVEEDLHEIEMIEKELIKSGIEATIIDI